MKNKIIFNNIKNLEDATSYIGTLKTCDIGWDGKRKFYSANEKKKISINEIVQKLYDCYNEKYSSGSVLKKEDSNNIEKSIRKIKKLDNESYFKLRKSSIFKKITHYFSSCFGRNITMKKDGLFTLFYLTDKKSILKNIKKEINKSKESFFLNDKTKTKLNPSVKKALDYAYTNYYGQKYKDKYRKWEARYKIKNEVIHRYNHGLAHAVRKVFYIPFVVDYFERNGLDHLTKQLQVLIEEQGKENVIAKLQIVMAFEVVGRDSECSAKQSLKTHTRYLEQSQQALKDYCLKSKLVGKGKLFKDKDDLDYYSKAILEKYPNQFRGKDMDVITAIVEMTHCLDLFRCFWPTNMKNNIHSFNRYSKNKNNRDLWSLARFCQRSVKITGDRLMSEFENDEIRVRNFKFKNNDLIALLYDNFKLTKSETFIKCSRDIDYCWEILQGVPHPISYSKGETMYSYLKSYKENTSNKTNPVKTKSADIETNEIKEMFDIISNTKAAIRLVNKKKKNFWFEMNMINDPVFSRPVRRSPEDRNYVLTNRAVKTVEKRGYKERVPLLEQEEKSSQPKIATWGPVHNSKNRGKAKFTKFTKKLSLSLLRSDGKVFHFKGKWPKEYYKYKPIGMLYDIGMLDQKGEKFIFEYDVNTLSKFWVGKNAASKVDKKKGREENLTLQDLQDKLNKEVAENAEPRVLPFLKMQHAPNEVLMGLRKKSLKAVFSIKDAPKERIRVLLHAVYLAQDYGINIPVLIMDGKSEPRIYSADCLRQDLEKIENKKIVKKLFLCFYSPEEAKNLTNRPEELCKKCEELLGASVLPNLTAISPK